MSAVVPLSRRSILDALRPPDGWFVDSAIGTTFSLDFQALSAVLLSLAGEDGSSQDPVVQLAAVLKLRQRVRVFVHAGGVKALSTPSRLHPLLDRVVEEVRLDGANFHPKVWILKLLPRDAGAGSRNGARFRVVCSSRNLSLARTWEVAIQLDGEQAGRGRAVSAAAVDLAGFSRKVLGLAADAKGVPSSLRRIPPELARVRFESGREIREDVQFRWQWPTATVGSGTLADLLPKRAKRILVISPFVNATFLRRLEGVAPEILVVSTQNQLDALSNELTDQLEGRGFTFKVVRGRAELQGLDALDLHAKLLVIETHGATRTVLGSANATRAGFGLAHAGRDDSHSGRRSRNAEAVAVLSPGLDWRSLERGFLDGAMVESWKRHGGPDLAAQKARRSLEAIRDAILATPFKASWESACSTLTLTAQAPLPEGLSKSGVKAIVWPLQLLRRRASPLSETGSHSGLVFQQVKPVQVSRFFAIALRDAATKEGVEWVQGAALSDDPHRDRDVQRAILHGRSPLTLVARLLGSAPASRYIRHNHPPRPQAPDEDQLTARAGQARMHRIPSAAADEESAYTLEQLLEACSADPALVREIGALVHRLNTEPDDHGFTAFVRIWGAFEAAWKRAGGGDV